jgi:hypothetical protein
MSDKQSNQEPAMSSTDDIVDNASISMSGHILIRDKKTQAEIVNKRNAIHYGNMARIVALALNNTADAYINFMAFGNGGTTVDTTGRVVYRSPRVSESYEQSASLYNKTYHKDIQGGESDADNRIEIITGSSFTDIKMTVTLGYDEPSGQSVFDDSFTNEGEYVFDELGIFSNATEFDDSTMMTHVIFHPVQKSQNRIIEIIYTIRVQLS